jgi:hypothetical protein
VIVYQNSVKAIYFSRISKRDKNHCMQIVSLNELKEYLCSYVKWSSKLSYVDKNWNGLIFFVKLWISCCYRSLGFWRHLYLQVDADVSEKHAVSIFRGCLHFQPLKMETARVSETSSSTCKYTRHQNSRLMQNHHNDSHENLKSHLSISF